MTTTYVKLDTIQRPATGLTELSQWADQVNDNFVALGSAHCRVWRNAAWTSITTAAAAIYDQISGVGGAWDPLGSFSSGTTYTCPVKGFYLVKARLGVTATAANQWINLRIYQNGVLQTYGPYGVTPTSGLEVDAHVTDTLSCAAGDTIQIWHAASTAGLTGLTGQTNIYASFDFMGGLG